MKILYLTFYFEPDLCAGSFRNTPIVKALAEREEMKGGVVEVLTTMPNRYSSYKVEAEENEEKGNVIVRRVPLSNHKSGFFDQIVAFKTYFVATLKIVRNKEYDLVIASSSRLFTAFLGAIIARKKGIPLFLDIRDLFRDTITEVIKNRILAFGLSGTLRLIENYSFGYASHINLVSEGFKSYFKRFKKCSYSYHTNGIDEVFLSIEQSVENEKEAKRKKRTILYAGNIGEGQGLHHIIPEAAIELEDLFEFVIIGDGGARKELERTIKEKKCRNVTLLPPMNRDELIKKYILSDFLFVHLNDLKAFKRVLPSKLFEYGAFNKPIIAGLSGYAALFVDENISNHILFEPCDTKTFVDKLRDFEYKTVERVGFKEKFARDRIISRMVSDIINWV